MEENIQLYTHAQMTRWKAIAQGLIAGREARINGLKTRDNPDRRSAYGKGWRKGWRREDRKIRENQKKLRDGYLIEGTEIFYIPPKVTKKNGQKEISVQSDLMRLYKERR